MLTNLGAAVALLPLLVVDRARLVWIVFAVMAAYGIAYALIGAARAGVDVGARPRGALG